MPMVNLSGFVKEELEKIKEEEEHKSLDSVIRTLIQERGKYDYYGHGDDGHFISEKVMRAFSRSENRKTPKCKEASYTGDSGYITVNGETLKDIPNDLYFDIRDCVLVNLKEGSMKADIIIEEVQNKGYIKEDILVALYWMEIYQEIEKDAHGCWLATRR